MSPVYRYLSYCLLVRTPNTVRVSSRREDATLKTLLEYRPARKLLGGIHMTYVCLSDRVAEGTNIRSFTHSPDGCFLALVSGSG
jgi:hypothetical protein